MLSLEFWGAQKEAPEARKQEFALSLEFLVVKRAVLGCPGGRKEHYYHVFKQNLQRPRNLSPRLRGGNRHWFWAPHLARGLES